MAKKAPKVVKDDSYSQAAEKNLFKIIDRENLIPANSILEREKKIVPLNPTLNLALNGGIPEGTMSIFSGPPKCGKTILALEAVKNAQRMGKKVYWIDIEGRLSRLQLTGVNGLDVSKMEVIGSKKGRILAGQELLDAGISIIKDVPECLIVFDSYSTICSSNEMESDIKSAFRSETPRLLATFSRRMAGIVPVNDTIVIGIQHVIANQASPHGGMKEDGGDKIIYQTDTKMRCTHTQDWVENDRVIGQKVHWKLLFGALGIEKNCKVESWLRHGYGYDDVTENIIIASEFGIIEKGGSWYTLQNGDKYQGIANLRQALIDDEEAYLELKGQLKETIGI